MSALLRDLEVYITHDNSLPAHALGTSLEEATKKCLWNLVHDIRIPTILNEIIDMFKKIASLVKKYFKTLLIPHLMK
jgi:hypothetical protein